MNKIALLALALALPLSACTETPADAPEIDAATAAVDSMEAMADSTVDAMGAMADSAGAAMEAMADSTGEAMMDAAHSEAGVDTTGM